MEVISNSSKKVLKKIVNALIYKDEEAEALYYRSINNASKNGTQNGKNQSGWDRRYNSIIRIAEKENLTFHKINRSIWEAVIVADEENNFYLFFRDKNLKKLVSKSSNTHYAKLLIRSINSTFDEIKPLYKQEQLDFLENEVETIYNGEILDAMTQKILSTFEREPEKIIIITFDNRMNYDKVYAYAFNTSFEIVLQENLTYLLETNYDPVLSYDDMNPEKQSSQEKIKPKKIVKLKQK